MAALTVRLSPSEKARFERMQKERKMSVNALVGDLIEKCELRDRPLAVLVKATETVNSVGKEINVVARTANSAGRVTAAEIDAVIGKEDALIAQLKEIVSQNETLL